MWSVKVHPLVVEKDLPALDKSVRRQVLKAIQKKLVTDPKSYGAPLHDELFGYWKLRVGDYRVVYRMNNDVLEVLMIKVGIRRDSEVYKSALQRLQRSGS